MSMNYYGAYQNNERERNMSSSGGEGKLPFITTLSADHAEVVSANKTGPNLLHFSNHISLPLKNFLT